MYVVTLHTSQLFSQEAATQNSPLIRLWFIQAHKSVVGWNLIASALTHQHTIDFDDTLTINASPHEKR